MDSAAFVVVYLIQSKNKTKECTADCGAFELATRCTAILML
jgi:hypothetical protein